MSIDTRVTWKRYSTVLAALLIALIVAGCAPAQQPAPTESAPSEAAVEQFLNTFRSFGGEVLTIDAANPAVSAAVSTVGTTAAATVTQGNPPCAGFIEPIPSMVVKLDMAATALDIAFDGATNATLIILDEAGQILCDENAPLTNQPTFTISDPTPQRYAIYVGRTNMQQPASGPLTVTAQP